MLLLDAFSALVIPLKLKTALSDTSSLKIK